MPPCDGLCLPFQGPKGSGRDSPAGGRPVTRGEAELERANGIGHTGGYRVGWSLHSADLSKRHHMIVIPDPCKRNGQYDMMEPVLVQGS